MSGWIKIEKDLITEPRFRRMVKAFIERSANVTHERICNAGGVTQVLGALAMLWIYADTHIRDDDTLDIGADEINEIVGIAAFAEILPVDWLEVLDADRVKLPGFQIHNGTDAKKAAQTAKRVARHRIRNVTHRSFNGSTNSNAVALPDQTRPDQTRPDSKSCMAAAPPAATKRSNSKAPEPEWFAQLRALYPARAGDQGWARALRSAHARIADGNTPDEILDGARRYADYCRITGKLRTEYVKQAATFLGPEKAFLLPWVAPASKADTRLQANLDAAAEFMRNTEPTHGA